MAGFGNFVQKAFYLGVGAASYAAEKAGGKLAELREQAQKLAEEMVARGEITAEEGKRMVDEIVNRAQQPPIEQPQPTEPRRIEILTDDESESTAPPAAQTEPAVDDLRAEVAKLQEELRRLKRE